MEQALVRPARLWSDVLQGPRGRRQGYLGRCHRPEHRDCRDVGTSSQELRIPDSGKLPTEAQPIFPLPNLSQPPLPDGK